MLFQVLAAPPERVRELSALFPEYAHRCDVLPLPPASGGGKKGARQA